jgi:hypothetical protein
MAGICASRSDAADKESLSQHYISNRQELGGYIVRIDPFRATPGLEGVKKLTQEQKHLPRRRGGRGVREAKKEIFFAGVCALAALREILHFSHLSVAHPEIIPKQSGK